MRRFHVVTFVDDERLYDGMVESFSAAGFDRFTPLRDGEPFSTITELGRSSDELVILCHQDVRLDQGDGARELAAVLDELTERDPRWAVAGNAGGTRRLALVRHLADPHGADWERGLPRRVTTLDENFLVLRTAQKPRCSPELAGFHLYGSDVCLHADQLGSSCYVVDFRLTHLSAGGTAGFEAAMLAFATHWRRRFLLRYIRTPSRLVGLSRLPLLGNLAAHPRTVLWVKIAAEHLAGMRDRCGAGRVTERRRA